jgi:hypothetical protein
MVSRLNVNVHNSRENLGEGGTFARDGWVCRHDLAEACRLAMESTTVDFDILHVVGTAGAEKTCNVGRTKEVLGLEFRADLQRFREPVADSNP